MKRYIKSAEDVFGMSKIYNDRCLNSVKGTIPEFVWVSSQYASHGPRLKFNGGTAESNKKHNSPTMKFDCDGNCQVVYTKAMNRKNCPNAYDSKVIDQLTAFVHTMLPVLLLMWFERVREDICEDYIRGYLPLSEITQQLNCPAYVTTLSQLDTYCRENDLYTFDS